MTFFCRGFLQLLALLCVSAVARAETHVVRLHDFYYEPQNLTITQGDKVRFEWVDAFHDAVAGNPPGFSALPYQDVFSTGIDDSLPFVREVEFSRDVLVNAPAANNRYDYYCTPHFTAGMVGSITVVRTTQDFTASPAAWQVRPPNSSSATASCSGTLNGDESEFAITCTHNVQNPSAVALFDGFLNEQGQKVCDLTLGSTISGTCALTQDQANKLYDGRFYVEIRSAEYPAGEVRGQLTRVSADRSISGKVSVLNGTPLSGAIITDGTRTSTTNTLGEFTLTNVPSGAYQLSASKDGFVIVADDGVSPLLVNGSNATNRTFTALQGAPRLGDRDGDGVSDIQEENDGTNADDPGSFKPHLGSPIRALWNGFIDLLNIVAIINKSDAASTIQISLHDISGAIVHQETRAILANGETDIILNDLPGFTKDSFGLFTIEFDESLNGSIDGQMFYYRYEPSGWDYEFAFGVPFTAPSYGASAVGFNTFNPSLDPSESENLVAQWLSIVNLDQSNTQTFVVKKYNQLGTLLSESSVSVPPFGRVDLEGGHVDPGPRTVGLNVIEPQNLDTPYLAQLYRYGGNAGPGASPSAYSFAFPLLSKAGSGQPLSAAVSTGGGADNWVEIVNVVDGMVRVEVVLHDENGAELHRKTLDLPAHSQHHLNAGSYLPTGGAGTVTVTPNMTGSIIGQSMYYFRDSSNGRITAMYGSPLQEAIGDSNSGSYNLFLNAANWLKIQNTSDETAIATVRVFPPGASENTRMVELSPHSSVQLGLHESQYGTQPDSFGVLKVESEHAGALLSEVVRIRALANGTIDFAAPTPVR